MVVGESGQDPEITGTSYAMGWFVESYRGHARVHHGGNIDGFSAMVSFVPARGVGVVALTNLDGTPLPQIVARQAVDRLLGLPPIDWSARLLQRREAGRKADKGGKAKGAEERKTGTLPARALDEYVGDYEHPAYGVVARDPPGHPGGARARRRRARRPRRRPRWPRASTASPWPRALALRDVEGDALRPRALGEHALRPVPRHRRRRRRWDVTASTMNLEPNAR